MEKYSRREKKHSSDCQRRFLKIVLILLTVFCFCSFSSAAETVSQSPEKEDVQYSIGVDDILEMNLIQPDQFASVITVSPDGYISFPYIGVLKAKGKTLSQLQDDIESKLADGFMKYPIVSITLKESRSRKFFVYGEVIRPGTYSLEENTTVLRAISMAGGFNRFGSSSRVKLLKPRGDKPGYATVPVNIKAIMEGISEEDILLYPGDIVVVTEGIF